MLCKKENDIILLPFQKYNNFFFHEFRIGRSIPAQKINFEGRKSNSVTCFILLQRVFNRTQVFWGWTPTHKHTPPPAAPHCRPLAYSVQYVFILNLRTVTPVLAAYWRVLYCIVFINILFIKIRFYDLLLDLSNVSLVYTCIDLYIQST